MKKVFFAFVAASTIVLAACNNKPAGETEATVDTTAVTTAVENTAPVEAAPVDSTAPAATDSAAKM